jgi:hypothetical protein
MSAPPKDKSQQDKDRRAFSDVVAATVAATEPASGVVPGSMEHRRMLLLEYKRRTEEARVAQEERLAKLVDAQRRIDNELKALDHRGAAEPEPLPPPPEVQAAVEPEPSIVQRKRQVAEIQRAYVEKENKAPSRAKPSDNAAVRRAPRFEVHAVVRFGAPPDDVIMRARNVSMTGALLATEKGVLSRFALGSEHAASVFMSEDPRERVSIRARVVRHEDNALVVDWSEDVEASFRIALLISTLPA